MNAEKLNEKISAVNEEIKIHAQNLQQLQLQLQSTQRHINETGKKLFELETKRDTLQELLDAKDTAE